MGKSGFSWKSPLTALLHDLVSIPSAWMLAYWLRFNFEPIPEAVFHAALVMLPWVIVPQASAFWYFGLYRGVWRFASLPDLVRICKAVLVGSLLSLMCLFLVFRLQNMPRAVFPLYALFLLVGLGGSRFFYRWLKDKRAPLGQVVHRVLIVGSGHSGEGLCRELLRKHLPYVPICFVDDDGKNRGRDIHGVRVMGTCLDIPKIVSQLQIDIIMVALPEANAKEMRRIHAICETTSKPVHTLPGINDLVAGKVSIASLRHISLEDLLGRDPIVLDKLAIEANLTGQRVLVSGGAGSIGSELCRQILKFQPSEMIVVDHSEYHLFLLEQEFVKYTDVVLHFKLLDVCDAQAIKQVFTDFNPHIVFHAAAYKHVPLLQNQARAAIRNNVLGTLNLAQACVAKGVEKFVLVSTDKAVNPTSLMGASKRAAELVCQHFSGVSTRFITVRFGNVLGSRGSVVETFQKQLEKGGPLTVTHPEMTRFFMTTKEACQLILQAAAQGEGSELYVLDMGEPVKIRYMAEQMIRLAGKKLNEDIQIEYIGLREGEKLYEELFHKKETLLPTPHTKILRAKHRKLDPVKCERLLTQLQHANEEPNESLMLEILNTLVPEYNSDSSASTAGVPLASQIS